MKASSYNILVETPDNDYMLFNSYSGSLSRVVKGEIAIVNAILKSPDKYANHLYYDLMKNEGYLIDDDFSELSALKEKNREAKEASHALLFTILSTLACNFGCGYCFEDKKNIFMEKDIQDKLIRYVDATLKRNHPKYLHITWFGGEPLLRTQIITELTNSFIELCDRSETEYNARIVTNGYFLDRLTDELIAKLHIQGIQITIDGSKRIHDERRTLLGGQGTFTRIMRNIQKVSTYFKGIGIRVNVDKTNIDYAHELFDVLIEYDIKDKVSIYFAPVDSVTEASRHMCNNCLIDTEFSQRLLELFRIGKSKGYHLLKIPVPKSIFCGAENDHTLVIDPLGNMYKCWNDVSYTGKAFATLDNPVSINQKNLVRYRDHNPFENNICSPCKLLPVCSGGCANKKFVPVDATESVYSCIHEKHTMNQLLQTFSDLYGDKYP